MHVLKNFFNSLAEPLVEGTRILFEKKMAERLYKIPFALAIVLFAIFYFENHLTIMMTGILYAGMTLIFFLRVRRLKAAERL